MTVGRLEDDHGTAERIAALAEELDAIRPGWESLIDLEIIGKGDFDAGPLGQVRATFDRDDPRWVELAALIWSMRGSPEAWEDPRQWELRDLAWRNEVLSRLARGPYRASQ